MKTLSLLMCQALLLCAACADDDRPSAPTSDAGSDASMPEALLPTDQAGVEAFLASGAYLEWHCEPTVHAARMPSAHTYNRICSNDRIASNANGTAAWPKGAAAVKELYASADSTDVVGYAYYVKTEADSAGGANWYWYEQLPTTGVVAAGFGDQGVPKQVCVACHSAAGSQDHTPTAGARDQVYTPVP
ncbi:MAG: cytochrome P460 family protein [Myxococcales bacterium]